MHHFSKRFPSKTAFITGGASGLGKEFCLELAQDGWTIGLCDIDEANLQAVSAQIEAAGGKPIPFVLDVADPKAYGEVARAFLAETQNVLDLLINNAGVGDAGMMEEYGIENWNWMVGINQMGVVYGCHYFLPHMKQRKSGHIMNIASAAAFVCIGGMAAYNATKASVRAISETLDSELIPFNIQVSVVMPTFFKTNIMQHARGNEESQKVGQVLIDRSNLSANEVANQILNRAGRGRFYIVLPRQARWLFRFKNIWPSLFLRMGRAATKKQEAFKERLRKKKKK